MRDWFKKRREARTRAIASEVVRQLEGRVGWQKFLPPVALRDSIYLVTENGEIYRMSQDGISGMEVITKIRN